MRQWIDDSLLLKRVIAGGLGVGAETAWGYHQHVPYCHPLIV